MEPNQSALLAVVALPFLGAALAPLLHRVLGERTAYFAAAVALSCLALLASQFGAEGAVSVPWIPGLGVEVALYLDGLALLVGFLASGIGVLVFVYSAGYMHHEPGRRRYYPTMLAFMGSMLGVALAADLVALFVFWELTSLTSYLLIGHYRDESGRTAARKALVVTVAGGLFMLVGFLLLYAVSGDALGAATFRLAGGDGAMLSNPDAMATALREAGLFVPVLALVGIGAAAKSAQVPLHFWLPDAMEAPTPVSAFLHSATMVKAGVYLVGRFRPLLESPEWTLGFAVLGLVTMTVAAMLAVGARDVKELLAYSTASHLGLIVAGFAFASAAGAETGAFHVINHALFKAPLFLVAGIVAHETGTRLLSEVSGLRRELPFTAAVAVVTALGMAGLPPFNGFYSKELLFEAAYHAASDAGGLWWLLPALAVFASVFTVLYSLRFLAVFFGPYESPQAAQRPPLSMLAPAGLLAVLAGLVGVGGLTGTLGIPLAPVESFVGRIAESVGAGTVEFHYYVPTSPTPALGMSAVAIVAGLAVYPAYGTVHGAVRRLAAVGGWRPDGYYRAVLDWLDHTDAVAVVQTGRLATGARLLAVGASAFALAGFAAAVGGLPTTGLEAVPPAMGLVLLVAVVGGLAVVRAPSHIAGVLTLSLLGFMIAIFFILARAPDLALTQLVVETLILVLLLLVLDRLPAFYGSLSPSRAAVDAVVAGAVGLTVGLTVLLATAASPADRIAEFFVAHGGVPAEHGPVVVDAGGGGNLVNVILVDFRAFDTLGEISVIALAALSILALIALRDRGEST